MATSFSSLHLSSELQTVIQELGYQELTPIQAASLPVLLEGKDLIGQAKTGSGKTAAFALPILQKLNLNERSVQAIVLCPTRELGTQIAAEFRKLGRRHPGLQILLLAGGQPVRPQLEALRSGVHIVVGTPGRILDVIERGGLDNNSSIATVVLDEADKMLEMGFQDEVAAILEAIPPRQTVFFSATFPETIELLSREYQKNPERITIDQDTEAAPAIQHFVYEIEATHKVDTLMRVLQQHEANSVIVFCNQKSSVAELLETFKEARVSAGALHGDLEQKDRDKVMTLFRNKSIRILVATDVAARGLDIEDLELVINFDLPQQTDVYVHRIGRTGRAGKTGVAVSLAASWDGIKLHEIEKAVGAKFQRPSLGFKNQHGLSRSSVYCNPEMQTLVVTGGRKDKLRPGDLLGALTNSDAGLKGSDIGKIEVHDQFSYVAIPNSFGTSALQKLKDIRVKGRKYLIKTVKTVS